MQAGCGSAALSPAAAAAVLALLPALLLPCFAQICAACGCPLAALPAAALEACTRAADVARGTPLPSWYREVSRFSHWLRPGLHEEQILPLETQEHFASQRPRVVQLQHCSCCVFPPVCAAAAAAVDRVMDERPVASRGLHSDGALAMADATESEKAERVVKALPARARSCQREPGVCAG
jgi:hypothetical protein